MRSCARARLDSLRAVWKPYVVVCIVSIACRSSETAQSDGRRDEIVDAAAPDSGNTGPDPTIEPGAPDRILLLGTIVTPEMIVDGAVLVEGNQITCVDTAAACAAMPGATGATKIDTKGVIAPGMVETHNHILFDIFDD